MPRIPEPSITTKPGKRARNAKLHASENLSKTEPSSLPCQDRFYFLAEEYLNRRNLECQHRCPDCWHFVQNCICCQLPRLDVSPKVRIILYMHYLEWQNAGNSGKLLVKCLGETSVKILIYGRKQDDEHLIELVAQNPRGAAILFPRPGGKLLKDFVQACLKDVNSNDAHFGPIILIALDATYSKAKTMAKHLERILPSLTMVQLDPTNLVPSSFGRAQKYSKSNPHRVCTTEAVAVALFECGEPAETMSTLMQAVKTNHTAVDPGQARRL